MRARIRRVRAVSGGRRRAASRLGDRHPCRFDLSGARRHRIRNVSICVRDLTRYLIDSLIVATEIKREEGVRQVYKDHNLHVLWGVTLMAVLGTSSITPAFPTIVRALGISSGQVGLLITFFTLPGIVMTPLLGVLSDRYGRKKILVPALLFFQGMGAAALGTLNVTVIGDIYDGRERSSALGYNSSVLSVGTASYP